MNPGETDLKPLLSICIPVFNGEKYIETCIKSVLEQNYENFELLILDNCSSDSTASIVLEIKDDRIKYIKNDANIGSINNFNKCIELASGDLFLLLPHDDLLLPKSIEIFSDIFSNPDIGFAYSATKIIDEKGSHIIEKSNHSQNRLFNCEEAITDVVNYFVPIQLAMVRTEVIKKQISFDSDFGLFCDIQLWLRIIFDDWKTFYFSSPLSCHRIHSEQGQNAFHDSDLKTLSDHWGKDLNQSFWKKNSYNNLLLKLIFFISNELKNKTFKFKKIEHLLIKIFVRSHLKKIYLTLSQRKMKLLWFEILLFKKIVRFYGFFRIMNIYLVSSVSESFKLFSELFKKIINMRNNIS